MGSPVLSALERREPAMRAAGEATTAFRLFSGAREGIPGLVIERYGPVLIFQVHDGACALTEPGLREIAGLALSRTGAESVYVKRFVPDRSRQSAGEELYCAEPFAGVPAAPEFSIRENGILYEIHPYEGYSTGIFLDQRANRRFLAERASGKRVLNCFSYTCAFSVASAKAGAETTSVDLSRKYLEWGKRNFSLNGISVSGHRFIAEDSFEFFRRAEKRGERFDLVIVDPPSFSRNGRKVFSLQKDVRHLLELAANRVQPGGNLFFSCNFSRWDSRTLAAEARLALGKKKGRFESLPETPFDFCQESHPLSAVLLQIQA